MPACCSSTHRAHNHYDLGALLEFDSPQHEAAFLQHMHEANIDHWATVPDFFAVAIGACSRAAPARSTSTSRHCANIVMWRCAARAAATCCAYSRPARLWHVRVS